MRIIGIFNGWSRNLAFSLIALLITGLCAVGLRGWLHGTVTAGQSGAVQVIRSQAAELPPPTADFFTEYRIERDRIRSERSEILRDILRSAKTEEVRQKAQDGVLSLMAQKQKESEMENLIRGRGFSDAIVLVQDSSVSAIIKAQSLTREDVIRVADAIGRVTGVKPEDITISAKP